MIKKESKRSRCGYRRGRYYRCRKLKKGLDIGIEASVEADIDLEVVIGSEVGYGIKEKRIMYKREK